MITNKHKKIFYIPQSKSEVTEGFWGRQVGIPLVSKNFVVDNLLFFNREIVFGDIVKVKKDSVIDRFVFHSIIKKSSNSILLLTCTDELLLKEIENSIRDLKCDFESLRYGNQVLFSILVPISISLKSILQKLKLLNGVEKVEILVNRQI